MFLLQQIVLQPGSQTYGWWAKPPVEPVIRIYVYNMTNADEFLNNGSKPILDELGPYVYLWVLKINYIIIFIDRMIEDFLELFNNLQQFKKLFERITNCTIDIFIKILNNFGK